MKLDPKIYKLLNGCILAFLVWAIVGVFINAKQLSSVSVRLLPGGVEHQDKTLLLIGKGDQAADYQLKLHAKEGWVDLGTFANTPIGDGLTFTANESLPIRGIQEVRLLDNDKLESDTLEQGPLSQGEYLGQNYGIKLESTFSIQAGLHWFFSTPVGIAILAGIGIAVFIRVFPYISI